MPQLTIKRPATLPANASEINQRASRQLRPITSTAATNFMVQILTFYMPSPRWSLTTLSAIYIAVLDVQIHGLRIVFSRAKATRTWNSICICIKSTYVTATSIVKQEFAEFVECSYFHHGFSCAQQRCYYRSVEIYTRSSCTAHGQAPHHTAKEKAVLLCNGRDGQFFHE